MNILTTINKKNALVNTTKECFAIVRTGRMHHDDLVRLLSKRVYQSEDWDRVPRWCREYINGYVDALRDAIFMEVIFVFPWKGELYDKFGDLPEEGKKWYLDQHANGVHVWKDRRDRLFTGSWEETGWNV